MEVSGRTVKTCLIKHISNNWYNQLSKRGTHARIKHVWYAAVQTNKTSPIKYENKRNNNLLLTKREGRTGEYWPEAVAVRTERSEVRTKTTEGQYFPVRLELARLVSSLLYSTCTMLVLSLPAFENKKYTASDRFHGNGSYGEIPTKKEPITTLGFTLPYNNLSYWSNVWWPSNFIKHD